MRKKNHLFAFLVVAASQALFAQATTTPASPAAIELQSLSKVEEYMDEATKEANWVIFKSIVAPSNDAPCNAIALTPSTSCNPTSYNIQGATMTFNRSFNSCENPANRNHQDIWFRVTFPAGSTNNMVRVTCSSGLDANLELFTGGCSSSSLSYSGLCADSGGGAGDPEVVNVPDATGGAITYYIRLRDWSPSGTPPTTFNGTICATSRPCTSTVSTPSLSAQDGNTMCEGGSKTITAANVCSGCSLAWEDGSSDNPRTVNSGGAYTLQVTDACGNTRSSSLTITENQAPTVSINGGMPELDICQTTGQSPSGRLTVSGASSYLWENGSTSASRTVTSSGTYTVVGTRLGCSTEASINVNINPAPTGTIDVITPLCTGGQGELMVTAGGCSYFWNTGSSDPNITIATSGNYRVTFTDGNGCSAVASRTVQAQTAPNFVISSPVNNRNVCEGSELNLLANNAAVTWEGEGVNGTVMNAPIGTYTITATLIGANGCSATQTRTVNVNANPQVGINEAPFVLVCSGNRQSLTAISATSYIWSSGQRTATIQTSTSGIYTVTGTLNGCTATAEVEVLVSPAPTATLAANQTNLQSGDLLTLTVNSNDAASVLWEDGNTDFYREFNPTQSTVYRATITDGNGCTGTASISIAVQTTSGILGNDDIAALRLYPNPSSGIVNVEVTESNCNIVVMDVLGRTMHTGVHSNGLTTLDLSTLVSGTYVVRVISETGVAIGQAKFIKL